MLRQWQDAKVARAAAPPMVPEPLIVPLLSKAAVGELPIGANVED